MKLRRDRRSLGGGVRVPPSRERFGGLAVAFGGGGQGSGSWFTVQGSGFYLWSKDVALVHPCTREPVHLFYRFGYSVGHYDCSSKAHVGTERHTFVAEEGAAAHRRHPIAAENA